MAVLANQQDLGKRLCVALGVEPDRVVEINLRIAPGELVTADVRFLPSEAQVEGALEAISAQRFILEKLP